MKTYFYAFGLATALLVFHLLGMKFNLYLNIMYYDIFMHILGGFCIGVFVIAVLGKIFVGLRRKRLSVAILVIIAGILWELFEAYYNIAGFSVGTRMYYVDTIKDLIDDLLGGLLAIFLMLKPADTEDRMLR